MCFLFIFVQTLFAASSNTAFFLKAKSCGAARNFMFPDELFLNLVVQLCHVIQSGNKNAVFQCAYHSKHARFFLYIDDTELCMKPMH